MGISAYLYAAGAVAVGLYLVRRFRVYQWGKCKSKKLLSGKIVVITGASSGLGKQSALELAKREAIVVMACRNMDKTREAVDDIRRYTSKGELIPMHLDLADFSSIKKFATEFREQFSKLDVLMNNAGVVYPVEKHMRTAQDYEIHFGVNHLGHFMLTGLLMDRLQVPTASRVVIVTSSLYKNGHVDIAHIASGDNLKPSRRLNPAYANSKLCNVLFGRRLAQLVSGTGVHVYSACPGWVYTDLFRHSALSYLKMAAVLPIAFLFMRSVSQGVQTQLTCAVDERLDEQSGRIYANCRPTEYQPPALDEPTAEQLWQLSEQLTGVRFNVTELEIAQSEQ